MKCEVCGKGPADGTTVHRQNPVGEIGIWRCSKHSEVDLEPEDAEFLSDLEAAVGHPKPYPKNLN